MWKPIDQLDRSFEGLDRPQHSIAAQYRSTRPSPPAQQVRPVREGTGLPSTAESWVVWLWGRWPTSHLRSCPVLVWQIVELVNYHWTDKLYSIGYFRKQRAVGFRESDVKTFLIVFNKFPATHKSSIRG